MLNILMLYKDYPQIAKNYWDHLYSFREYSSYQFSYAEVTDKILEEIDFDNFDCIILHYGLGLNHRDSCHLSQQVSQRIRNFRGVKFLFTQDEYTTPHNLAERAAYMGINHIFTCVADNRTFRKIFPKIILPDISFDTVLTGYVAEEHRDISDVPLLDRKYDIVYRGNALGYYCGTRGAEKFQIGMMMKRVSKEFNLTENIDWRPNKKIFNEAWFSFLQSGKTTLCSETGASLVLRDERTAEKLRETFLIAEQSDSWEEFKEKARDYEDYIAEDNDTLVSGISPKAFEAIACGTVLVCYEGEYSGVLLPDVHYIPLKKDLSNKKEVVEKIKDTPFLEKIRKRAFVDIIQSNLYSYRAFVKFIDFRIENVKRTHFLKTISEKPINNNVVNKNQESFFYRVKKHFFS